MFNILNAAVMISSSILKPITDMVSKRMKLEKKKNRELIIDNSANPDKKNDLIIINDASISLKLFKNLEKIDFQKFGNEIIMIKKSDNNIFLKIKKTENEFNKRSNFFIKITKEFWHFFNDYKNKLNLNNLFYDFEILQKKSKTILESSITEYENNNPDNNSWYMVLYLDGSIDPPTSDPHKFDLDKKGFKFFKNIIISSTTENPTQLDKHLKDYTLVLLSDSEHNHILKEFLSKLNNEIEVDGDRHFNLLNTINSTISTSNTVDLDNKVFYEISSKTEFEDIGNFESNAFSSVISKKSFLEEESVINNNTDVIYSSLNNNSHYENFITTKNLEIDKKYDNELISTTETTFNLKTKKKDLIEFEGSNKTESYDLSNPAYFIAKSNLDLKKLDEGKIKDNDVNLNSNLSLDENGYDEATTDITELYDITENVSTTIQNKSIINTDNKFAQRPKLVDLYSDRHLKVSTPLNITTYIIKTTKNIKNYSYTTQSTVPFYNKTSKMGHDVLKNISDLNLNNTALLTEINSIENQPIGLNHMDGNSYNMSETKNTLRGTEIKTQNKSIKIKTINSQSQTDTDTQFGGVISNIKTSLVGGAASGLISTNLNKGEVLAMSGVVGAQQSLNSLSIPNSGNSGISSNVYRQPGSLNSKNKDENNVTLREQANNSQIRNKKYSISTTNKPELGKNNESIQTQNKTTTNSVDKNKQDENNQKGPNNLVKTTSRPLNQENKITNITSRATKQVDKNTHSTPSSSTRLSFSNNTKSTLSEIKSSTSKTTKQQTSTIATLKKQTTISEKLNSSNIFSTNEPKNFNPLDRNFTKNNYLKNLNLTKSINDLKNKIDEMNDFSATIKIVQIVLPVLCFLFAISLLYKYGKIFKRCFCRKNDN